MTKDMIAELEALKGPDHLVLAEMLNFVADRLMTLDADQLCGVSAERKNHRKGYRQKAWETHAGRVDLKIPKLRKGPYFPEFLESHCGAEQPMTAVILEAYVQGLSTRSVEDLLKAMGMTGVSKSQASRLCADIHCPLGGRLALPLAQCHVHQ